MQHNLATIKREVDDFIRDQKFIQRIKGAFEGMMSGKNTDKHLNTLAQVEAESRWNLPALINDDRLKNDFKAEMTERFGKSSKSTQETLAYLKTKPLSMKEMKFVRQMEVILEVGDELNEKQRGYLAYVLSQTIANEVVRVE